MNLKVSIGSKYENIFLNLKLPHGKVGSLITKDVGHVFLPALVEGRLLLSFVISDPTLLMIKIDT